jgi:hypothetical protein
MEPEYKTWPIKTDDWVLDTILVRFPINSGWSPQSVNVYLTTDDGNGSLEVNNWNNWYGNSEVCWFWMRWWLWMGWWHWIGMAAWLGSIAFLTMGNRYNNKDIWKQNKLNLLHDGRSSCNENQPYTRRITKSTHTKSKWLIVDRQNDGPSNYDQWVLLIAYKRGEQKFDSRTILM